MVVDSIVALLAHGPDLGALPGSLGPGPAMTHLTNLTS
jgi:hypothetical protein